MLAWIAHTPVKGLGLLELPEADLTADGLAGDRRFYLVDERGRLTNGKRVGQLQQVRATWDEHTRRLALRFPDGSVVDDVAESDGEITTSFYGRPVTGRVARGPFAEALSEFTQRRLALVEAVGAGNGIDRGRRGTMTILSVASLERLAQVAGVDAIDRRRFRMSLGIDDVGAHEEDGWIGRRVQVGDAVVRPRGNVGRCVITARDPDNGERDLDTLGALGEYRADMPSSEKLPFGVYGEVLEPARVRVGDPVRLLD